MSLANIIKLQQQRKASESAKGGTDSSDVRPGTSAVGEAPKPDDLVQSEPVSLEAPAPSESPADNVAAPAAPVKSAIGGLKRLGALGALRSNGAGAGTQPSAPRTGAGGPANSSDSVLDGSGGFSLDDLASLDESAAPALRREAERSEFVDEIEATAPDRALPEGLEAQQLNFVEQLDGIYSVLTDPEMFAQSVRLVMMELQENPEYIKLVSDQDIHTMLRGMRNSMGLARVKKQDKSRKTTTSRGKAGKKITAETESALKLLEALGGDDD